MEKFSWELSDTISNMALEQGMDLRELIAAGIDLCRIKTDPREELEKVKIRLAVAQNRFNFAIGDDVDSAIIELEKAELNYKQVFKLIKEL